jgi:hypothetical protein
MAPSPTPLLRPTGRRAFLQATGIASVFAALGRMVATSQAPPRPAAGDITAEAAPAAPADNTWWLAQAGACQKAACQVPSCPFCGARGDRCPHVFASHSAHSLTGWGVSPFTTAARPPEDHDGTRLSVIHPNERRLLDELLVSIRQPVVRAPHVKEKWFGLHQSGFTYFSPDAGLVRAQLADQLEARGIRRSPIMLSYQQLLAALTMGIHDGLSQPAGRGADVVPSGRFDIWATMSLGPSTESTVPHVRDHLNRPPGFRRSAC